MKKYDSPRGFCHSQAVLDVIIKIWLHNDEKKMDKYFDWIEDCHFAMDMYLETHPDIDAKFRTEGYQYYDVMDMAKPTFREENNRWNIEIYEACEEFNNGMLKWMGSHATHVSNGKIVYGVNKNDTFVWKMLAHWGDEFLYEKWKENENKRNIL